MSIQDVLDNKRQWHIETGDALESLRQMPDNSVHCVVTSPPYWNLRDYGVDGQIGLEKNPREFVSKLVQVFAEVRRVLRNDGTLWLNLGDSFASGKGSCFNPGGGSSSIGGNRKDAGAHPLNRGNKSDLALSSLKPKDLMLMPHRVAIALQEDGWYVRQDNVWAKGVSFAETYHGSSMPESVTDRPSRSHEYIFLLTKSESYFYDKFAVAEKIKTESYERATRAVSDTHKNLSVPGQTTHSMHKARANGEGYQISSGGRNLRSVWCINPEAFPGNHFATFATKLVSTCVLLGTSEKGCCAECGAPWKRIVEPSEEYAKHLGKGFHSHNNNQEMGMTQVKHMDFKAVSAEYLTKGWRPTCECESKALAPCIVFDPFSGAGTCVMTALRLGRRGIGIELNPEYAEMSRNRILDDAPLFNTITS